jgi:putative tryptophan/tyrosine transport system substrate-binding protein
MRRREFITLLGASAVAGPLAVRAQQPKVTTIGVLVRGAPGWQQFWQAFREALRELGYIEGQNIRFEFRTDQGQMSRLPELAAEPVQLKLDLLVTWYTPAAVAAKGATHDIPIVCALCGDLVGTGLAESLARPGGNVTGITSLGANTAAKSVELLHEMVPAVHRIAVLANAPDPWSKIFLGQIQLAGKATGTAIDPIMIHSDEELDAAFPAMERSRPDAIIVQPSLPTTRAAELALRYRIPAVCAGQREFVNQGGLMSYFAVEADMYRRVVKIVKGAKPADLPVEQPTRFELAINLKTAKALGLTIPPTLLARADEVIE